MSTIGGRAQRLRSLVTSDDTVVLSLDEYEIPQPAPGEVLLRVEAAPVNPSDLRLMFASGDVSEATFSGTAERPLVAVPLSAGAARATRARLGKPWPVGNEGAGTVVAVGEGVRGEDFLGRVVASRAGGMFSQFRAAPAEDCLTLPSWATAADGAAASINPMTVLGMVETMRAEGHRGLVHTAAASTLGQMLVLLCAEDSIPLVNIVRSPSQRQLLLDLGAEHVCDSSDPGFEQSLIEALRRTGATLAFDAVGGGTLANSLLEGMEAALADADHYDVYGSPTHKQVYLYGSLDVGTTALRRTYGMSWGVGGWLLPRFLEQAGPDVVERLRRRVVHGLRTTFATRTTDRVPLAGVLSAEAVRRYGRPSTGTKYLVAPHD